MEIRTRELSQVQKASHTYYLRLLWSNLDHGLRELNRCLPLEFHSASTPFRKFYKTTVQVLVKAEDSIRLNPNLENA
ncbi:hypothetical protein NQ315_009593 [Exocentrus adspersus]|uniref:Uncharacterized protein n=1 Tax=Exocentrus adspersus TaxID=1586481 RepID=A0AAV8WHY6_9CUCU|nr:hypothetical protein NQ315_009593 [Exocentrus adspersus]